MSAFYYTPNAALPVITCIPLNFLNMHEYICIFLFKQSTVWYFLFVSKDEAALPYAYSNVGFVSMVTESLFKS